MSDAVKKMAEALERGERVLRTDLAKMIAFGDGYNQAVRDAYVGFVDALMDYRLLQDADATLADLERREREQDEKSNRVAEMERTLRAWLEMQSQENRSALHNAGLAYFGIKSLIPDDDYDPDEGEVYP